MNLTRIGYFKEMPHAESTDPSIQDFIGKSKIGENETEMACKYLRNAPVLAACAGLTTDVIDPDKGISGNPSAMTDGVWVWPGDYVYYVETYRLPVNEDFLEHMKSRTWNPSFDVMSLDFDNLKFVNIDGSALA